MKPWLIHIGTTGFFIFIVVLQLQWIPVKATHLGDTVISVGQIKEKFENYLSGNYREIIYGHTNRNDFLTGEAMWFTAWCLDASTFTFSPLSKTLYIELIDRQGNALIRQKFALQEGAANGSIYLPSNLQSDYYLLRAYTAWMKNRSPETFFQQKIRIVNPFRKLYQGSKPFQKAVSLEFFPEGGNLVHGLKSIIACLSHGPAGTPEPLTVHIINMYGQVIKVFNTDHDGMATFEFLPNVDEVYKVMVIGSDSSITYLPFPEISPLGSTLSVSKNSKGNFLISIQTTRQSSEPLSIVVYNRSNIVRAESFTPSGGLFSFELEADHLQMGLHNVAVFNSTGSLQCQRVIYHSAKNNMIVEATSDKLKYEPRENIAINVASMTCEGVPLAETALSITVYLEKKSWLQPGIDISSYLDFLVGVSGIDLLELSDNGKNISPDYVDRILISSIWKNPGLQEIFDDNEMAPPYLPEFRGQLIGGQIQGAITGNPAVNQFVYLCLPGDNPQTYVSRSDRNGKIRFEALDLNGSKQVIVLPQDTATAYEIKLDEPFADTQVPDLPPLRLDSSFRQIIQKHSIAMQVQNAYDERVNSQVVPTLTDTLPFYGVADEIYYLDDYTRFTVMEEVFREYIHGVLVRRRNGKFIFRVIEPENKTTFQEDPLVLLDGIPVFDVDKIMAFDPLKIKKIEVITSEYYKGKKTFKGIVSMFTYDGDLAGFILNPAARILSYNGLQIQREFEIPDKSHPIKPTEPDYRIQLYWNGRLETNENGSAEFKFPASDMTGSYTVEIQALSTDGQHETKHIRIYVE